MTVRVLPGIQERTITTSKLTSRVLFAGDEDGDPVLFLHGNLSSATWWETTLLDLPAGFYGIAPDQRGYGDADPSATIDSTRGMGDLSDDAAALIDVLGIERVIVVGSSMGGSVIWRMIADHGSKIISAIQVDPGSPYGYGGTKGDGGEPTCEDFAGSGAGLVNPEMVARLQDGDEGTESPLSPRNVFRSLIVRQGLIVENEDTYVASMLSTHFGPDAYPGDTASSENWPFVAPGVHGAVNGLSPRWAAAADAALVADPKPSVLWIRGALDVIISDGGPLDPGTWGPTGLVPGYPGPDEYPTQPMVSQTRAWLERYTEAGGSYEEVIIDDAAHVPYIDSHEEFSRVLHAHLRTVTNSTRSNQ
jgi:pimeloyl-ACP methyl ester carboxylesterase